MVVAPGLDLVDLDYLGEPEAIAAALIETPGGFGVVDPGPTTSLGTLRTALAARGASVADLRWVLLTHIHLDHAGGTGAARVTWRTRPGCWRAPRGFTATRWRTSGASSCLSPPRA